MLCQTDGDLWLRGDFTLRASIMCYHNSESFEETLTRRIRGKNRGEKAFFMLDFISYAPIQTNFHLTRFMSSLSRLFNLWGTLTQWLTENCEQSTLEKSCHASQHWSVVCKYVQCNSPDSQKLISHKLRSNCQTNQTVLINYNASHIKCLQKNI